MARSWPDAGYQRLLAPQMFKSEAAAGFFDRAVENDYVAHLDVDRARAPLTIDDYGRLGRRSVLAEERPHQILGTVPQEFEPSGIGNQVQIEAQVMH